MPHRASLCQMAALVRAREVSPVELVQSRRLALAKQLLHDTSLSMTAVALASGWAVTSQRQQ